MRGRMRDEARVRMGRIKRGKGGEEMEEEGYDKTRLFLKKILQ